jgi:hypothetical protein
LPDPNKPLVDDVSYHRRTSLLYLENTTRYFHFFKLDL